MSETTLQKMLGERIEQVKKVMDGLREVIAKNASEGKDAERLLDRVHDMAHHEGQVEVLTEIWNLAEYNREDSVEKVHWSLAVILTRPADDIWSGRTNDLARVKADGRREGAATVMRWVTR